MPSYDLHSHSTVSDGSLSPTDLVFYAAAQGVDALALTDHDDVSGLAEARKAADEAGIRLVNGVEISVTWRKRTVHIVGLRIDPAHPDLLQGLDVLRQSRVVRAEKMADELSKAGIEGSLAGAYAYASDRIISRTHFARFLVERGYAKDFKSVFKKYLVQGKPGYVPHQWADMAEAVSWITGSGGVAVLAHPGRYDLGRTNLQLLLAEFKECGGIGLEVISGSHSADMNRHFTEQARLLDFLASRGSDYHGPEQNYLDMRRLPPLPDACTPIWQAWDGFDD
ncbi:MAG: PHP domain-containing protein [Sulfuricellaceae bacterium]|nr:PHP domain-containing protein [Sulfuricellaceae bacterium]